jgi:hypothetical protein
MCHFRYGLTVLVLYGKQEMPTSDTIKRNVEGLRTILSLSTALQGLLNGEPGRDAHTAAGVLDFLEASFARCHPP